MISKISIIDEHHKGISVMDQNLQNDKAVQPWEQHILKLCLKVRKSKESKRASLAQ